MRSLMAAGAAFAMLLGCAGPKSGDVASELKSLLRDSEGFTADAVDCEGEGELKQGDQTTCAVTVGNVRVEYDVVFTADDAFKATPKSTFIKKADFEKRLSEQQAAATRLEVTVDCGPQPIYDSAAIATAACTGKAPSVSYPVRVTVDGTSFSSSPGKPLVYKAEAEPFVASHLVTQGAPGAVVDCGPDPVRTLDPGSNISCNATLPDGSNRTVLVTVTTEGKLAIAA